MLVKNDLVARKLPISLNMSRHSSLSCGMGSPVTSRKLLASSMIWRPSLCRFAVRLGILGILAPSMSGNDDGECGPRCIDPSQGVASTIDMQHGWEIPCATFPRPGKVRSFRPKSATDVLESRSLAIADLLLQLRVRIENGLNRIPRADHRVRPLLQRQGPRMLHRPCPCGNWGWSALRRAGADPTAPIHAKFSSMVMHQRSMPRRLASSDKGSVPSGAVPAPWAPAAVSEDTSSTSKSGISARSSDAKGFLPVLINAFISK